jgi:nucleotide-binding universal stress UspA family protein
MKPIIAATDFSANSLNAVNYAADMAMAMHGFLILLHVYQLPISATEIPVQLDTMGMINEAENEMKRVRQMVEHRTKRMLIIETEVRAGIFFNELESFSAHKAPYAVVMGCQGTTPAERFLFGTHVVYAMKHLKWPVIAVPPNSKFTSIKKIGLACDFNHVVDYTPVEELRKLVQDLNATLFVLNTGKTDAFDPELVFQSGLVQEMLAPLHPFYHFIANDSVDKGIIDFAEGNELDMLIVLPKRHGLIDSLMHRSHTKQLVLHSHVPVMALHA